MTKIITFIAFLLFSANLFASNIESSFLDSEHYNPNDPNIEELLEAYDDYYFKSTGIDPHLEEDMVYLAGSSCKRNSCPVYINVNLTNQTARLYNNGSLLGTYKVSGGNTSKGHYTKRWDGNPNSRIYNKYSSSKYPGGDFNGLGNMPYAMFYYKGFAIHGTPKGNWSRLGREASHGCIRMHPETAKTLNRLVRKYGRRQAWFYIHY